MPWTIDDVDKHKKDLTDAQKRQWVAVANSARKVCIAHGRDEEVCDASAIKQANAVVQEAALDEAATIKATVRGFLKSVNTLLGEKTLPKAIREQVEGLRKAMRQTWSDLALATEPESEALAEEAAIEGEYVPLTEKSVRMDGTTPIKIIAPGWGSSGYYSPAVLERDGPKVFTRGVKMFWDHPTKTEEVERPERSLHDLAAELVSDARWSDQDVAGPGLYAEAKVFSAYQAHVNDLAPFIGLSIRALGKAKQGEAEGKAGPIIEEIVSAKSVDFVTAPGAGGQVLQLFESAREPIIRKEQTVDEKEAKALTEESTALKTENAALKGELAKLREGALLQEARDFVGKALPANLPESTRTRLAESLSNRIVFKDGKLDEASYLAVIEAAVVSELDYLSKVTVSGQITGMGSTFPATGRAQLKEAFKAMYLKQSKPEAEADRLAEIAAQGR